MKIETPLHVDHQLDQLVGQFAHWRQTRTPPHADSPRALRSSRGVGAGISYPGYDRGEYITMPPFREEWQPAATDRGTAQGCFGWGWTCSPRWGRVAPQGCPGTWASETAGVGRQGGAKNRRCSSDAAGESAYGSLVFNMITSPRPSCLLPGIKRPELPVVPPETRPSGQGDVG